MKLSLSCPGKAFLIGEYGVVNGGPSLLVSVGPRFDLAVKNEGSGQAHGIHPESPAGRFLTSQKTVFQNFDLQFRDPYQGQGGFGASSAQYLLANVAAHAVRMTASGAAAQFDAAKFPIQQTWTRYQADESVSGEGLRPSGADIVSQFQGGFTEFQKEPFSRKAHVWGFEDYDLALIHTGKKVATHEHLASLRRIDTEEIEYLTREGIEAFSKGDADRFFDIIGDFHAELLEQRLVAEHTRELVAALLAQPYVCAAKGSGALGSDLLTVYVAKENLDRLSEYVQSIGLLISATLKNVDQGLKVLSGAQGKMSGLPPQKDEAEK